MKTRKTSKKNIAGKRIEYADWRAEVVRLADEQNVSDAVRDQVTEPMMWAGWWRNEFPAFFLAKCVESFS